MTTTEERLRVLTMIEEGKITAEQGAQLLEALKIGAEPPGVKKKKPGHSRGQQPQRLRIRVTDLTTGTQKVNMTMPWGLVGMGVKMGAKFAPEGVDQEELLAAIEGGAEGHILDVIDEEDNERVEIFVE